MRKSLQGWAACRGLVCGGLLLLGGLASLPAGAQAFSVMQVTCNTILTAGEGTRKGLEDYVEIGSFHHGVSNTAGKNNLDSFRVVKSVTHSSIGLTKALVTGQFCQELRIERWGADPQTGESVRRWRVLASSVFVEDRKEWHAGSDAPAQESLEFSVGAIEWTYFDAEGEVITSWDFINNTP